MGKLKLESYLALVIIPTAASRVTAVRLAATRAVAIYNAWATTQAVKPRPGTLFASEDY